MIVEYFLEFIAGFLRFVTTPLKNMDDVSIPGDFGNSLNEALDTLSSFSFAFPVGTLTSVFLILIGFEIGYFTYKGIMWIIKRIPTQS